MGVSDKSLGYALTTAAAAIFFYYSIWVLVLVSTIHLNHRVTGFMEWLLTVAVPNAVDVFSTAFWLRI